MAKVSSVYPKKSRYLSADDVPLPATFTIESTEVDNKFGDDRIVLHLVENGKMLGLNSTNAHKLARELGDDSAKWAGRRIVVGSVPTTFQGKEVQGLRVLGVEE